MWLSIDGFPGLDHRVPTPGVVVSPSTRSVEIIIRIEHTGMMGFSPLIRTMPLNGGGGGHALLAMLKP